MSEPMITHFADEYTLRRLKDLQVDNAALRERIEQLEYMEARSATEAEAERDRAEFWKAECAARAWLLKDREQAGHDYKCTECFEFPHLADCDLARLMTMPEEPKP